VSLLHNTYYITDLKDLKQLLLWLTTCWMLVKFRLGNKCCVFSGSFEIVGVVSASDENEAKRSSQATHGKVSRRRRSRLWRHCQVKFFSAGCCGISSIFCFLILIFERLPVFL